MARDMTTKDLTDILSDGTAEVVTMTNEEVEDMIAHAKTVSLPVLAETTIEVRYPETTIEVRYLGSEIYVVNGSVVSLKDSELGKFFSDYVRSSLRPEKGKKTAGRPTKAGSILRVQY